MWLFQRLPASKILIWQPLQYLHHHFLGSLSPLTQSYWHCHLAHIYTWGGRKLYFYSKCCQNPYNSAHTFAVQGTGSRTKSQQRFHEFHQARKIEPRALFIHFFAVFTASLELSPCCWDHLLLSLSRMQSRPGDKVGRCWRKPRRTAEPVKCEKPFAEFLQVPTLVPYEVVNKLSCSLKP